ncbi:hypothetical protein X777_03645, partial [Ooceraea biroi]
MLRVDARRETDRLGSYKQSSCSQKDVYDAFDDTIHSRTQRPQRIAVVEDRPAGRVFEIIDEHRRSGLIEVRGQRRQLQRGGNGGKGRRRRSRRIMTKVEDYRGVNCVRCR